MTTTEAQEEFRSISKEERFQTFKHYFEDIEKGGWKHVRKSESANYWIKKFSKEAAPVKILYSHDLPMPAKAYIWLVHPLNLDIRQKWDDSFYDMELLEEYPANEGYIVHYNVELAFPLMDRQYVLYIPPISVVEWNGKKSYMLLQHNAWHCSKPVGEGKCVRAFNGGNVFIVTPDSKHPESSCTVYGLSHNNNNGFFPNWSRLYARKIPNVFYNVYKKLINGYKKYYNPDDVSKLNLPSL